jgi:meso-butanediol dehydrogenase/(S,S)-butanediol dehydrogenase/diacetyl reductase
MRDAGRAAIQTEENNSMKRFEGKAALVTGAASGIGLATAQRLAREGAQVFACDMSADKLQEEVGKLGAEGLQVRAHTLNVTDASACRAAVAAAVAACGRLDVLCNIAGIGQFKLFGDISMAEWDKIIAVNATAPFVMCQAALPHLLASKGNIVNMASSAGLVGIPYNAAYCASKGAILMLSKSLAAEFAGRGVRVNAVCPGGVNTPLTAGFNTSIPEGIDPNLMTRIFPLTPFNAEPEEIAGIVAYLASDEARFVTGAAFSIDGGQTAI